MNHDMMITSDQTVVDLDGRMVRQVRLVCTDCEARVFMAIAPTHHAAWMVDAIANLHAGYGSTSGSTHGSTSGSSGSSTVSMGRNRRPRSTGRSSQSPQSISSP